MGKLRQTTKVLKGTLEYTDTAQKKLFSLPKSATLLATRVHVVTAFNDSGADNLILGTYSDNDYFVSTCNAAAEVFTNVAMLHGGVLSELGFTGPTVDVYGTYVGANGDATAGRAIVICEYADPFTNP